MKKILKITLLLLFSALVLSLLSFASLAADEQKNLYTISWNVNGELVRESYAEGEIPVFKSNVPDTDNEYDYYQNASGDVFRITGWDKTVEAATASVTYTATVQKCVFAFFDSATEKTVYYTAPDLSGAFKLVQGVGHIKLYSDISLVYSPENSVSEPTVPEGKTLYLDLNGYFYSMSGYGPTNTKHGNLNAGKNAKLYVYSSREGGALYNSYKWWSSSSTMGSGVFGMSSGSEIHLGKVTYDGVTYPGDNLSVYMGIMCYNYGTGALYIDGGTYNATYSDAGGIFIIEKETVISAKNATFNTEKASFFRQREDDSVTGKDDPINVNFENCIFRSGSTKADSFISNEYTEKDFKMRFVGCEFALSSNVDFGRWTYIGEGCYFPAGADLTKLRIDEGLVLWNAEKEKTYYYKLNTFAFDDKQENGVRSSVIKSSSFKLSDKSQVKAMGCYAAGKEIDALSSVMVHNGFEYRFYLPLSLADMNATLTIGGEEIDFTESTVEYEGKTYYLVTFSGDEPISAIKSKEAVISRTRYDGREYYDTWELSVVDYMDLVLSDAEQAELHPVIINYLSYIAALCDYKGLVSQSVKTVITRHSEKIQPSAPESLGAVTEDLSSLTGFFHSIKLELGNSPSLILLVKPNAVGTARITYTDSAGEDFSILLERSLIKETETVDGVVYKRFVLELGNKDINFDLTINTYKSNTETGSVKYNLATYLDGVSSTNTAEYTDELVALIERLVAYSAAVRAYSIL